MRGRNKNQTLDAMKKLLITLLLPLIVTVAEAQNRKVNLLDNVPLEKIIKQAKREKKLIFLDFGSPACKPCLYMKKFVFTIDSVADFVNDRFVSCDYTTGDEKKRLSKIYNVFIEPVFLILDSDGTLMHRTSGQSTSDEMLARFTQGLDRSNNLAAQNRRYNDGDRSTDFLRDYLETLHIAGLTVQKGEVLKNIFTPQFDLTLLDSSGYWKLYVKYDESPISRQSKYIVENRAHFCKLYGEKEVDRKLDVIFGGKSRIYIFGSVPPADDKDFAEVLRYAQMCDAEVSRTWLANLLPAQHKYKDWTKMAAEIDDVIKLNVLVGADKKLYMKKMAEQFSWYCDDIKALPLTIRWIDALLPDADEKTALSLRETKAKIIEKSGI